MQEDLLAEKYRGDNPLVKHYSGKINIIAAIYHSECRTVHYIQYSLYPCTFTCHYICVYVFHGWRGILYLTEDEIDVGS